jgi:hypothetical protein
LLLCLLRWLSHSQLASLIQGCFQQFLCQSLLLLEMSSQAMKNQHRQHQQR